MDHCYLNASSTAVRYLCHTGVEEMKKMRSEKNNISLCDK